MIETKVYRKLSCKRLYLLGKMTIKCHLNFTWTKWGLQLQLGQIRVQLGQIRVSPLFVQMKCWPNSLFALQYLYISKSENIFFSSFFLLGRDNNGAFIIFFLLAFVTLGKGKKVGTLGIIVIKTTHLNTSWKLFCIPCMSEGGMKPF